MTDLPLSALALSAVDAGFVDDKCVASVLVSGKKPSVYLFMQAVF